MVLTFNEFRLESLEDIQKLTAKNLRDILRNHAENTGGNKADLVLKCYALLTRHVLPALGNSQNVVENQSDSTSQNRRQQVFTYSSVLQQISPLGWNTDLRQLPAFSFIQLYEYLVVSTRKYKHIVLKGTNYKKLKAYQFFFEGHIKALESKEYEMAKSM